MFAAAADRNLGRQSIPLGRRRLQFCKFFLAVMGGAATVALAAELPATPLAQASTKLQSLVQVTAESVTIRAAPQDSAVILGTAKRGTLLTVTGRAGEWLAVSISSQDATTGWIQQRQTLGQMDLQELQGPGPARMALDEVGDAPTTIPPDRPGAARGMITLPPLDPLQVAPAAPHLPRETLPLPDRWRLMQSLGFRFPIYDPYNQNVIKGDLPVMRSLSPDLFFNLGIVSDNLFEDRSVPIPVSQTVGFRSGANNIYGSPRQRIQAHTVLLSFGLTKGNTTFKPPDWEFRYAPAIQYNRVEVREAGALNIDPSRGTIRHHDFIGTQELFADYHLRNVSERYDFDSLRVGVQPFTSDFRGFLFADLPVGIRLFGNRDNNRWQYNLGWFRRIEKDTNSGLNDLRRPLRNDDIFAANLYRQDFPILGLTSQWAVIHNRNREDQQHYDTNGFIARPAFLGDLRGHRYQVTYLGYSADGHLGARFERGRFNLSSSTYLALGTDDRSPLAEQSQTVRGFFHASEISRDYSWIRLRASFLFASGDKDPYDRKATGFDAIFENPQFAGADTSYFIRQGIPLIGGGGVALSGRNGLLPSLRSSKEQGQSNFQNPGLTLIGLGADLDLTPELRMLGNISYLRFNNTQILGVLRNERPPDNDLGLDYSVGIQWRPFYNQNVILNASYAVLHFGEGLRQMYGNRQDRAHSAIFNFLLNF